jgi:hypothetical protein
MNKYYFTFGGFNAPELKNYCVEIFAKNSNEARTTMFNLFDKYWGFMYDDKPYESLIDLGVAIKKSNNFLKNI